MVFCRGVKNGLLGIVGKGLLEPGSGLIMGDFFSSSTDIAWFVVC